MNIVVASRKEDASEYVASLLGPLFRSVEPIRLGLATGETMIPIYQALVRQLTEGHPLGGAVETFNLDEYWPINSDHPGSFEQFMHRHLLSHIGPWVGRSNFLQGACPDPDLECGRFQKLLNWRPLDIQLLGLGLNGHIGFNEPGTSFHSRTRKVALSPTTQARNARQFPGAMPDHAITMGIADIMAAKNIILVVFGLDKKDVLARALFGPVSEDCPASILQNHPQVTVVADEEAGSVLDQSLAGQKDRPISVTVL